MRELVADIIAEGVGATVPATVRETIAAVAALGVEDMFAEGVTVRAVADKLRLDKSNAGRRLRVAADGGYLHNLEDKRGRPGRWVIGDPLPESVDLLPDPARLTATVATTVDQECCGVAAVSGGENESTAGDPMTAVHRLRDVQRPLGETPAVTSGVNKSSSELLVSARGLAETMALPARSGAGSTVEVTS